MARVVVFFLACGGKLEVRFNRRSAYRVQQTSIAEYYRVRKLQSTGYTALGVELAVPYIHMPCAFGLIPSQNLKCRPTRSLHMYRSKSRDFDADQPCPGGPRHFHRKRPYKKATRPTTDQQLIKTRHPGVESLSSFLLLLSFPLVSLVPLNISYLQVVYP